VHGRRETALARLTSDSFNAFLAYSLIVAVRVYVLDAKIDGILSGTIVRIKQRVPQETAHPARAVCAYGLVEGAKSRPHGYWLRHGTHV
jgi:hypothetical protein